MDMIEAFGSEWYANQKPPKRNKIKNISNF